jgi:DNA-binding response OmpR family regulator
MSVSKLADSVVRAIPDGERVSTVKEEHLLLRDGVLTYGDRVIELSRTELELFTVLYRHRGHPVSRQTLHEMIWGVGESNVLDVYVSYLRKKLEGATDKKLIVTVRGKGYMLKQ